MKDSWSRVKSCWSDDAWILSKRLSGLFSNRLEMPIEYYNTIPCALPGKSWSPFPEIQPWYLPAFTRLQCLGCWSRHCLIFPGDRLIFHTNVMQGETVAATLSFWHCMPCQSHCSLWWGNRPLYQGSRWCWRLFFRSICFIRKCKPFRVNYPELLARMSWELHHASNFIFGTPTYQYGRRLRV